MAKQKAYIVVNNGPYPLHFTKEEWSAYERNCEYRETMNVPKLTPQQWLCNNESIDDMVAETSGNVNSMGVDKLERGEGYWRKFWFEPQQGGKGRMPRRKPLSIKVEVFEE